MTIAKNTFFFLVLSAPLLGNACVFEDYTVTNHYVSNLGLLTPQGVSKVVKSQHSHEEYHRFETPPTGVARIDVHAPSSFYAILRPYTKTHNIESDFPYFEVQSQSVRTRPFFLVLTPNVYAFGIGFDKHSSYQIDGKISIDTAEDIGHDLSAATEGVASIFFAAAGRVELVGSMQAATTALTVQLVFYGPGYNRHVLLESLGPVDAGLTYSTASRWSSFPTVLAQVDDRNDSIKSVGSLSDPSEQILTISTAVAGPTARPFHLAISWIEGPVVTRSVDEIAQPKD